MDNSLNKHPTITDTTEAVCAHCKEIAYREQIISIPNKDNTLTYTRIVAGGFKQNCDDKGIPNGPIIPHCNCRG